jgi:HSP20 family protein
MALIHWQPLRELNTLRNQMDHLFDDLINGDNELRPIQRKRAATLTPAIEIKETDTDLILKAEIPGINRKDLDIQATQETVSITGEHQEEERKQENGVLHSEFYYGQFQRIIPLPSRIHNDQIRSEFKDGILTLTMPKLEPEARKTVKISLADS